jgi:hypothetical protein
MRFSAGISTPSNLGILYVSFPFFSLSAFLLTLALFMARVFAADHAHDVLAFDDLARFTKSFY